MRRKRIGCILLDPEKDYQLRILEGLTEQCSRYGYHLVVFAPMVNPAMPNQPYRDAEMRLLHLIDYDQLDGVVVCPITFIANNDDEALKMQYALMKERCRIPVVSIDYDLDPEYMTISSDDTSSFVHITDHLIEKHGCKKPAMLNGFQDNPGSKARERGVKASLSAHGMDPDAMTVYYGDFWFSGGDAMAKKIVSGEIEMPDSVICANDQMAIGLCRELIRCGIKVPEQIKIIGFGATRDAMLNDIAVTTFVPEVKKAAANAVDYLVGLIEPGREKAEYSDTGSGLKIGSSCGCDYDVNALKADIQPYIYHVDRDHDNIKYDSTPDIGVLLESLMLENLASAETPTACLHGVTGECYLLKPYEWVYMILRTDWAEKEDTSLGDYPNIMRTSIRKRCEEAPDPLSLFDYASTRTIHEFERTSMLPEMDLDWPEPFVFYFLPIHFAKNTFGYAVMQYKQNATAKLSAMHRNWLKNIANSFEINYVHNKLLKNSMYDDMTDLLNRHGMDLSFEEYKNTSTDTDRCLCMVIDMDNLKKINDTYGHNEGDKAIQYLSDAIRDTARENELAVRAGGDEFYIIGVGPYDDEEPEKRKAEFIEKVKKEGKNAGLQYELSASIGSCLAKISENLTLDNIIRIADADMYSAKTRRKMNRL